MCVRDHYGSRVDFEWFLFIERLPWFDESDVAQIRVREGWVQSGGLWSLDEYVYDYERLEDHPLGTALYGHHYHPLGQSDERIPHIKCVDGRAVDPHHVGYTVDVMTAIEQFFTMDASAAPITSVGLTPLS